MALFALIQKPALGFLAFWVRWPRKVAKLEAQKAWQQTVTPEDEEAIQIALDWQIPIFERRDPERIPHAATWIRGRRWDDEPPKTPTPNRITGRPVTQEQVTQTVAVSKIQQLIASGMDPTQAKRQVYLELGWIRE
jgi:hypothetical protein